MLVMIKGRLIKALVAPTSCIVLIINRLEYTESRIEALISSMATTVKIAETARMTKLILCILECIFLTESLS